MKLALLLILTGILLTGPATAERAAAACQADIKKFCAEVKSGGGVIEACLKQHAAELSPACNEFRAAALEKAKSFTKACAGDIKTLCADVSRGKGRIVSCLKKNSDKLSAPCKEQLSAAP